MKVYRGLGIIGIAVALLCASACATRPRHSNRFISGAGSGYVDLGGTKPTKPSPADVEAVARAVREAQAKRVADAVVPAQMETRDPGLRDALTALGRAPGLASHIRVAHEYERVGIRDLAFDHYSDALSYDGRSAAAWDGRARLWRDWGLLGLALTDAHKACYFQPRSAAVRNTLGTILERSGRCPEALATYREAVALTPEAAWAVTNVQRLQALETCR
jgi:Flp pilus assembly protein TadD